MRKIKTLRSKTFALTAAATAGLLSVTAQADDQLANTVLGPRVAQNTANAKSQAAIDTMSNETDDKLAKLKQELETIENLKRYNDRLRSLIETQEQDKARIQGDIEGVTDVERNILPLMDDMIKTLDAFIQRDIPFLLTERQNRVNNLKELMDQPDVTVAEKYRRLTEAYQIENSYATSMEAYNDTLEDGRTVEFLQVGRVLLLYRTPDADEIAYWDNNSEPRGWKPVDSSYRNAVEQGFRIARKQAPPDLISLPIPAPAVGGN